MPHRALVGAQIFDGKRLISDHAVLISQTRATIVRPADLPADCKQIRHAGGTIMPGFVDLQVNGGGGVMFNTAPTVETLAAMSAALFGLGTHAFLPTLITDSIHTTTAAIAAATQAVARGLPGVLGLHLEGPHLAQSRKGAHDPALIRPMTPQDLDQLCRASDQLPNLMVTLAPEAVTPQQITTLNDAGVIVFLGHSDADYDTAMRSFDAGARGTTHLFNAMSQLGSRAPGLVGATLASPKTYAGLIADGIHVHPATIRAALAAKHGPGEIFLVTDAMACAGAQITQFTLNGRTIHRAKGRLTLPDGTLAGADLDMAQAIRVMVRCVGDPPEKALARATSIPAAVLRDPMGAGSWPRTAEGLIYLNRDFQVTPVAIL